MSCTPQVQRQPRVKRLRIHERRNRALQSVTQATESGACPSLLLGLGENFHHSRALFAFVSTATVVMKVACYESVRRMLPFLLQ